MKLDIGALEKLFPHADIEEGPNKEVKVKGGWCEVKIGDDSAELKERGIYWSYSGDEWQERFASHVVELECSSEVYVVGTSWGDAVSVIDCRYVKRPSEIKELTGKYNDCWRAVGGKFYLCSNEFHKRYVW